MNGSQTNLDQLTDAEKRALLLDMMKAQKAKPQDAPLSHGQMRFWMLDQMDRESATYNLLPYGLRIEGNLNIEFFKQAIQTIYQNHDILRTTFFEAATQPRQKVTVQGPLPIGWIDLEQQFPDHSPHPTQRREAEIKKLQIAETKRVFNLSEGPLIHVSLIRLSSVEHVLLLTMHHIIADAWSIAVIMRELEAHYTALQNRQPSPIKKPAKQYVDFLDWEQKRLDKGLLDQQLSYWQATLKDLPPLLELPNDRPRPQVQSHQSSEEDFKLSPQTSKKLHQLCRAQGASLTIAMVGALKLLLANYSGSNDIAIGQAVSNRSQAEWEKLIGFFVNTVVLRTQVNHDETFLDHLERVKRNLLEAYEHKDAPFDKVVQSVGQDRSLSYSPLFQVLFALVDARTLLRLPNLTITPLREIRTRIQFDLHLLMWDDPEGIRGTLEYNTDIFNRTTIQRMLTSFTTLLDELADAPQKRLSHLSMVSQPAKQVLIGDWNQTQRDHSPLRLIHQQIEAMAKTHSSQTAIIFKEQNLSYQQFNQQANQIAHYLLNLNLPAGSLIGVCLERSHHLCITLLGILKAGFAYVPLDPDHPSQRLAFQVEDANPALIITEAAFSSKWRQPCLLVDDASLAHQNTGNPNRPIAPNQPAYVIYTSGSTGQPKAAVISHEAISNRLFWMQRHFNIGPQETLLQKTPYSFDVSLWELFWPFMTGARLVIAEPGRHWDTGYLRTVIQTHRISHLHFVPSMLALFLEEPGIETLDSLVAVVCSGEALSTELFQRFKTKLGAKLFNLYGPTEAAVDVTATEASDAWETPTVPIGKPIDNTQIYVCNPYLQLVPQGVSGELLIGGVQLASGYLARPALTAQRFIPDPFGKTSGGRLYRSGDLVRQHHGGTCEYLSRIDFQVKIRGFRIELGEIEAAITALEAIREACVVVQKQSNGHDRLIAYVVCSDASSTDQTIWREALAETLPEHMVPSLFVVLEALPLSKNGKVDRKQLPQPGAEQMAQKRTFQAARTPLEKQLAELWAELLGMETVGIHDRFFELGGHSYLLIQMHRQLCKRFDKNLTLVELFKYPTIAQLALRLQQNTPQPKSQVTQNKTKVFEDGIAIIGMAGRFPGANSTQALWENLINGVESISFFDEDTLNEEGVSPQEYRSKSYVPAAGVLDNIAEFDANFFGFNPREAEITDPQQRLFMECAYEALEHSGHSAQHFPGRIGVFAGTGMSTYFLSNLVSQPSIMQSGELYQVMVGNDRNFPATQASHKMNLDGPSVNVANACSSSLIAVHLACKSLLEGEADMALAGGMKVMVPHRVGYHYQEGNIHSPDGHCRAFDASAKGIVMSSGGGLVVLRRLQDALSDGDHILAVIKGSAINNDGADKVGFMAPGARGQEDVIASAHQAAQIDPETISYVEAHGTGTKLGDPIEIAALTAAFRQKTDAVNFCDIGSIKTNMGHLDHAAGIAGLIKTVLALGNRQIPPNLHFQKHNPGIDFENSPFRVVTQPKAWQADGPLRAGVSSFGIGGTNAHVVLEEAPQPTQQTEAVTTPQLWITSAKTASALKTKGHELAEFYQHHQPCPEQTAFTLQLGRNPYPHRQFVVWDPSLQEAFSGNGWAWTKGMASGQTLEPIFLFPGQGSQHLHMLADLYRHQPVFNQWVDTCADLLTPMLGLDIRSLIYPKQGDEADGEQLNQTQFTQPALFTVSYAAGKMLQAWGIHPKAMLGHSIGEYVAACFADVFSLEDALQLVAKRGQLMASMPPGAMLAIDKNAAEVQPFLDDRYDLAAINAPNQIVVSGSHQDLLALKETLGSGRLLKTSHGFHSKSMDAALEDFEQAFKAIAVSAPKIPVISNLTGKWLKADQACDPAYWSSQLRHTVQFAQGMDTLTQQPNTLFLEVGAGQTLSNLAKACLQEKPFEVLALARHPKQKVHDLTHAYQLLGNLWIRGAQPHWRALHQHSNPRRIALPTYPFERKRFWVDPGDGMAGANRLNQRAKAKDWFYIPSWQQQSPRIFHQKPDFEPDTQWLILGGPDHLANAVQQHLFNQNVVRKAQSSSNEASRSLGSETVETYAQILAQFEPNQALNILDLTAVGTNLPSDLSASLVWRPIVIAKALTQAGFQTKIQWSMVTQECHQVLGSETLQPHGALLAGPAKVFSQEFEQIQCCSLDLDGALLQNPDQFATQILCEFHANLPLQEVAHRGRLRWAPTYVAESLDLPDQQEAKNDAGVYLITGGLGGIGYTFAQHFAQQAPATLVLTGRRIITAETEAGRSLKQKIQHLEQLGATVVYRALDVCDEPAMNALFAELKADHPSITAIIHTAGIAGGGLAVIKTEADAKKVLDPKVKGTLNIAKGLELLQPAYALFCSSTTAILGGVGQVDYCAANSFQDAMALSLSQKHQRPVLSVNWPAWQQVGMAVETDVPEAWRAAHEHNIAMGISPQEGVEALERILASGLKRAVVSTVDINLAIAALAELSQSQSETLLDQAPKSRHERPPLPTPYAPPRDEVEQTLADVWSTFLGIDGIGIHDDFFALGGHSLLATQIVGKLKQQFQIDLQLHALFDNPTIADLALLVIEAKADLGSDEELEALLKEVEAMGTEALEEQTSL